MATSAWFDYSTYMSNKLAQLQKNEPAAGWTEKMLLDTFKANGFGGADGAERHFLQYGQNEDVAPNAFFNATEYLRAKAAEYFKVTDPKAVTAWQVAELQSILEENGMSAWSHYQAYGSNEGVNPSNQFDSAKYMDMKLKVMQATDPTMTLEKLEATFAQYGYSALTHFLEFGGKEGEVQLKVVNGKIPTELSVDLSKQVEAGGTNGKVYTLTEGADTIEGTVFDDVINGMIDGTNDTLDATDSINGGAGTDTLNIVTKGEVKDATGGAAISNVEIVNIRNTDSAETATLNASLLKGVTNVNTNLSTGKVTITGLSEGVAVGMIGNGKTEMGAFEATYVDGVTKATLNLMNGVKGTAVVTIDTKTTGGITDVTVTSTGAANSIEQLDAKAAKNIVINAASDVAFTSATAGITTTADNAVITVKGAGKVELGGVSGGDKLSVNAAENTGGVDVILTAADQSFTGGIGSDTVEIVSGSATSGKLEGGAGAGVDTLVVNGALTAAHFKDTMANTTGFETLRFASGGNVTYDLSAMNGLTAVEIANIQTSGLTLNNAVNKLNIVDDSSGAYTATVARDATLTSKDLALTLQDLDSTDKTGIVFGSASSGLVLTGYENVTINSLGGLKGTDMNKLYVSGSSTDLKTIKISGDSDSALKLANAEVNVNLDATDFAHKLDYTFVVPTAATKITGGTADDIFRTTTDIDNKLALDGGAGIDELNFSGGAITLEDADLLHITNVEVIKIQSSDAVKLTAGGYFDNAFKDGVTIDVTQSADKTSDINLGNYKYDATVKVTANSLAASGSTITTGEGNDTVTFSATNLSGGDVKINTGAGNDTINVVVGNVTTSAGNTITGGLGADTINFTGSTAAATAEFFSIIIGAGDSTIEAHDTITGFVVGDGTAKSMHLDLAGSATLLASATLGTKASTDDKGLVTFTDTTMTHDQKVAYLVENVTTADKAVVFVEDGNSWVFHNGANGEDALVELAGLASKGLMAGAAATEGLIWIS